MKRSLIIWVLLLKALLAMADSTEGVPLNRSDLDALELYRQIPTAGTTERRVLWQGREDRYPLDHCALCDGSLGENYRIEDVEDMHARLCGPRCQATLQSLNDSEKRALAEELRRAVTNRDLPNYPLDDCPVSGKDLAEIASPLQQIYDWTLIQLADSTALEKYLKDPEGYALTLRMAMRLRQSAMQDHHGH